jgi:26S proteasome regulatory subunit N7
MGSDPQFAKYPDLSLAQDIFTLTNPHATQQLRQTALKRLQDGINEHKMAPLYRHLAHPSEGLLNTTGESASSNPSPLTRKSSNVAKIAASHHHTQSMQMPWDEAHYEELVKENEEQLAKFQKEEDDAAENAGEIEVNAARGKRAEFWARVGDKVCTTTQSI